MTLGETLMKVMAEDESLQQIWWTCCWDLQTLLSQYDIMFKQWQQLDQGSMEEIDKQIVKQNFLHYRDALAVM